MIANYYLTPAVHSCGTHAPSEFTRISSDGAILRQGALPDHLTFLSKASLARALDALPPDSRVEIDGRRTTGFDYDALEALFAFRKTAREREIDYRLVGFPDVALTPAH